jgi:hypothetical protein
VRLAQHVAASPHRFDEVAAFGGVRQLLAQLDGVDARDQFVLVKGLVM